MSSYKNPHLLGAPPYLRAGQVLPILNHDLGCKVQAIRTLGAEMTLGKPLPSFFSRAFHAISTWDWSRFKGVELHQIGSPKWTFTFDHPAYESKRHIDCIGNHFYAVYCGKSVAKLIVCNNREEHEYSRIIFMYR